MRVIAVCAGLISMPAPQGRPPTEQPIPSVQYPAASATRLVPVPATSANVRPPRNCAEARAWGLQNIPRGSPYYAPWLDRDNDGLGCEPWHGR